VTEILYGDFMTIKRIGIGIIGIQGYGTTYFNTLKTIEGAEVVGLCDINLEAARRVASQNGVEKIFSDYHDLLACEGIDAVFIATPHFLHHAMTIDALRAGKHVFCEKPLAITAEHAQEMVETARGLGLTLSCHYNRRQSAPVKLLRNLVAKEVLGEIYTLNARWMARWTGFMFDANSSWRVSKAKAGGGILIGRGSHMLDAALYILGHPRIKAINAQVSSKLTGFEVDDYAFVSLRLANGGLVNLECSYEAHIPDYQEKIEYEVFGTRAGAYCSTRDGVQTTKVGYCEFPNNQWIDQTGSLDIPSFEFAEPITIIGNFVAAVRNGCEPNITAEQGALITQILAAAYRSSEQHKEIDL
jgi:predicted dehydrogenase